MSAGACVSRACPICGEVGRRPELSKGDLRLARCSACQMVYATPVPEEFVSGEFYDRSGLPFYLSPAKLKSDYAPVRFERELRLFRVHGARGRVLDVGCSTGAFLHWLRRRYPGEYQGEGTDVTRAALDYAESQGVRVIRRGFLEAGWAGKVYDAVTFWAVLEHLGDPKAFVRQAAHVLRPGGLLFALVPNYGALAVRLLGAKYRYIMVDHVNYFTRHSLRRLIEQEPALEILAERSSHWNPVVLLKDRSSTAERVPDAERAGLLERTTKWKQNPWLLPLRWGYRLGELALGRFDLADNLVVVARKRHQG